MIKVKRCYPFFVLLSLVNFFTYGSSDIPLVIAEIQNSIEREYNVKFPVQKPLPAPDLNKKKEVTKKSVEGKDSQSITNNKAKQKVRKKGLLEDDDSNFIKYKGPKKLDVFNKKGNLSVKERIALRRQRNQSQITSKLDKIRLKRKAELECKGAKANSKALADANARWEKSQSLNFNKWEERKKESLKRWEENKKEILKRWDKAKKKYKKEIPTYKGSLTEIPFGSAPVNISTKAPKEKFISRASSQVKVATTSSDNPLELSYIEEAFKVPIKNQGGRPTCAAFAAIRAVEIASLASGKNEDYSEQWFYYASKPTCQKQPCNRPGSWPRKALLKSMKGKFFDIPLEKNCPYKEEKSPGNETQIPLKSSCRVGVAKIGNFSMVKNRYEIQERIRAGQTVIGGFKLNEGFFLNTGFVFNDPGAKLGKGMHAQGHAILLVGVMELPKALHQKQGRYCTIIANSWGEGWGKGGHACVSDAWFDRYRYPMSFIAIESVKLAGL